MYQKMFPHNGLLLYPGTTAVSVSGTQAFQISGASGQVRFTVMNDTTGGATVNATTGVYTAGTNAGTSTVGVVDEKNQTAFATVTVHPALTIIPAAQNVIHGQPFQFKATGGVPPLKFTISDDQSGGATIEEKTGLYKAGNTAGKA